ncbi:MAG: filamentous hemagglutinin N-terminal domain-containing protein [Proteobacteria bacterium]|nr:filamentous hemagglutinin N-terminal domain-containing protein [Pseudomonadota bacterium]HQR05144.1 filamentous hemagglutinin N-terminal domain-containing protein [Rhodocyclaceae bacterium]
MARKSNLRFTSAARVMAVAVSACFAAPLAHALPVAPNVVAGSASFNQAGNTLTVTNSNGAIINWAGFSIGSGETTHFLQPSASSSVLNRVLGADPSLIYGTLSSNGRVWLINPAGIMIGPGALVNTAGFVASTLNISNASFLAGKLLFDATPGAGAVVNRGAITTPSGGSVYLVGPSVENGGIITTPGGETLLAAGQTVQLIDTGTPGVKVEITGAAGNATNLGQIVAEAGQIGIAGVLVKNSGTLNASSVVNEGGRVFLRASRDAYVDGAGRIVTTGTRGGSVEVLGNRVAVMDDASIDASGTNAGGSVLVGGDFQGKNPAVENAWVTYFGPDARIQADATAQGKGGKVVIWSDDTTRAYGTISAKGVGQHEGGQIETSGHRHLDAAGIRVTAGEGGEWLLDPADIVIFPGPAGSGSIYGVYGGVFDVSDGPNGSIADADISNTLNSGTSVIVRTDIGMGGTGSITLNPTTNIVSTNASASLSLLAYGGAGATGILGVTSSTINIAGGVNLVAGWDGVSTSAPATVAGSGNLNIIDSTIQSGGSMSLLAGNNISLTATNARTFVGSVGMQTVSAGGTLLLQAADSGHDRNVALASTGGQIISAHNITLNGGNGAGVYNNYAVIGNISDNSQSIAIYGGGAIALNAGNGNGADPVYGGSFNFADIAHNGVSNPASQQYINFVTGGSLTLNAGSDGTDNWASIQIKAYNNGSITSLGNQYVGSSAGVGYYPTITLYGGTGGSSLGHSNDATISLGEHNMGGNQSVEASSLQITAGSAAYSVAGIGGGSSSTQVIQVSGALGMQGGSSSSVDADGAPGGVAFIGSKSATNINLAVGGAFFAGGGSGTQGTVLIGSLQGGSMVTISAHSVELEAGVGGVMIGSASTTNQSGTVNIYVGTYASPGSFTVNGDPGDNYGNTGTVLIGARSGQANVTIYTQYGGGISLGGGGGGLRVGTGSTVYGATINLYSGPADLVIDDSTAPVAIGSMADGSVASTTVNLYGGGNLVLGAPAGGQGLTIGNLGMGAGSVGALAGVRLPGYPSYCPEAFCASTLGGNLSLGSSVTINSGMIELGASAGMSNNPAKGNITVAAGSTITDPAYPGPTGITIIGDSSVTVNGSLTSVGKTVLAAGTLAFYGGGPALGYFNDNSSFAQTFAGGNLDLSGASISTDTLDARALRGIALGGAGNVTQNTGTLLVTGGMANLFGMGSVTLNGVTTMTSPGATFTAGAGMGVTGTGAPVYSGMNLTVGTINAAGSTVSLEAGGAIMDGNGSAPNVTAGSLTLISQFGGSGGGPAISLDTAASSLINASVASGAATNGGISVRNLGAQPSMGVYLADNSSAGGGITFTNSGDLFTQYLNLVENGASGGVTVITGGNLTVNGGNFSTSPSGGLISFGAAGYLNATSSPTLSAGEGGPVLPYDLMLQSGGALNFVGASMSGNNITVNAGGSASFNNASLNAANKLSVVTTGALTATNSSLGGSNSVSMTAAGPMAFVYTEVYTSNSANPAGGAANMVLASGGGFSMDTNSQVLGSSGVAIVAGNVSLDDASSIVTGNGVAAPMVSLVVSGGNITLNNGSYIQSGDDVSMTLTGANAQVVLNSAKGLTPSFIKTDVLTQDGHTATLNFTSLSSGGVTIDGASTLTTVAGGSGFFVVNPSAATVPATPGNGLVINYYGAVVPVPGNTNTDNTTGPTATRVIDQVVNGLAASRKSEDDKDNKRKDQSEGKRNDQDKQDAKNTCT